MIERNPGCEFDLGWLNKVNVNLSAVNEQAAKLAGLTPLKGDYNAAWVLKSITCIDLTTLGGDDTESNVKRLCFKAAKPLPADLLKKLGFEYNSCNPIHTAAVCVYPSRVKNAAETLEKMGMKDRINVASVATGFPSGQYPLSTRLAEIKYAVEQGATEIDIVIDRSLVLTGQWEKLYQEIQQMKEACGSTAHMKSILATGELGTLTNVYKASLVAMMAGSDFIKTSTGKESVNATIPFGIVMCRAIREYYEKFGYKVGLKPAGGIRTSKDAVVWLRMVQKLLGTTWLDPELFRFGASGLLSDMEYALYEHVTGRQANPCEFTMG